MTEECARESVAAIRIDTVGPARIRGAAFCEGLRRPHERTHELAIDLGRKFSGFKTSTAQKCCSVICLVDSGRLDRCFLESDFSQEMQKLFLLECTGNAANPKLHVRFNSGRNIAANDHIRNCEPAARLQYPISLLQDGAFVAREVDHAIGDNNIDRCIGKRNLLDLSFEELD